MSHDSGLPVNRFELWIVIVFVLIGMIAVGSCITLWKTRDDFERGMTYMQEVTGKEYVKNQRGK